MNRTKFNSKQAKNTSRELGQSISGVNAPLFYSKQVIAFILITVFFTTESNGQRTLLPSDWNAEVDVEYTACTGALSVGIPIVDKCISPCNIGDENNTYRLTYVDLYIREKGQTSKEYLTSIYRGYKLPLTPELHTSGATTITVLQINNFTKYYYTASRIQIPQLTPLPVANVESFTPTVKTNGKTLATLVFARLPSSYLGKEIEIVFENLEWGDGLSGNPIFPTGSTPVPSDFKALTTPTMTVPGNATLMATPECGGVRLNWTAPMNLSGCSSGRFRYQVFRDNPNGTPIYGGTSGGAALTFLDMGSTAGMMHTYYIKTVWSPEYSPGVFNRTYISPPSTGISGSEIGLIDPPSITSVGSTGCSNANSTIDIAWTNPLTQIDSISILRSTFADFSADNEEFIIAGNRTAYSDNTAGVETTYYYKIRAINECGIPGNYNTDSPPFNGRIGGVPSAPSDVTAVPGTNIITVRWKDESTNETAYEIWRSVGGNNSLLISIPSSGSSGGYISHPDMQIQACNEYSYTVRAINSCDASAFTAASTQGVKTKHKIDNALSGPGGSFTVSKGYFTNRVELKWTLTGNTQSIIQNYNIERRILGSGDNFVLLQQVSGGGIYNDQIADAGILYEYRISGTAECGSDPIPIESDKVTAIGFRNKSGLVTGNVAYAGGNAVRDVKIQAESSAQGIGKSISMNGGKIIISPDTLFSQDLDSSFIFESWIKPNTSAGDFFIIEKTGSYKLAQTAGEYKFEFGANFISVSKDSFPPNQWNHISVQVSDSMYIYRNGEPLVTKKLLSYPAVFINPPGASIELFNGFQGKVTEVRLWNNRKDSTQILRDATRHVVGEEKGLFCFLPMSEGSGTYAYDRSKKSFDKFNKNDGELMGGALFDSDIPTPSQLTYAAYTDTVGNYVLSLPYTNAGENYELIPIYFTHEFDPKKRLLYVGDGSTVINNVDFLDKSSFLMTGNLKYEGTNCVVPGARLKIDGEIVIVNGSVVQTDADGEFEIQVPIGEHYIEIEKEGHTFSRGRWPEEEGEVYDFQAPEPGVSFLDNTQFRLVGRAVGGSREAEKVPIIGKSINNIGMTEITLSVPETGCGWETGIESNPIRWEEITITDSVTGVYDLSLPPWAFDVKLKRKNEVVTLLDFFGEQEKIDLRYEVEEGVIQTLQTEYDTTEASLTVPMEVVDSIKYHKEINFVHFAEPSMEVVNKDGSIFFGEEKFDFQHSKYQGATVDLKAGKKLDFPVLISGKTYDLNIRLFEEYINIDDVNSIPDRVPIIRGEVDVDNKLATDPVLEVPEDSLDSYKGIIPYKFVAGTPDLLNSNPDPNYSFTKVFNITYTDPKDKPNYWMPFNFAIPLGKTNPSANFRGYVFGSKIDEGTDHIVQGPNEVDYILRDPPVGNAFATISEGTSFKEFTNWNVSAGGGVNFDKRIKLGPKLLVGVAKITSINVINSLALEVDNDNKFGESNTAATTTTFTKNISTSDIANNIGDGSDLFIGTSNIYLMGTSTNLGLYPIDACNTGAAVCFGDSIGVPGNEYRLGKSRNYALQDKTLATEFVLTKTDIVEYEIPKLIDLRNQLLQKDSLYNSVIGDPKHENYGKNNDDEAFGAKACRCYHWETNDPQSYIFKGHRDSTDQVRKFNEDISNWIAVLAANEEDKAISTKLKNRFSFDGGGSSIELSSSITRTQSKAFTWEVTFKEGVLTTVGADVDGVGAEIANSVYLTQNSSGDEGIETDTTQTISYTLKDEDIWDRYTIEVIESEAGWGPIFKVVSGETSCPHVGPLKSQYYSPGTELSGGTIRLEQPELKVDNPVLRNVPEDDVAEFVFRLGNNSDQGWGYRLGLLNHTNEGGAIIVNSGTSELGSEFVIGAGEETSQIIQIVKGGAYKNDSLLFVLASTCQYDIGNDFDEDIADTVYVSVTFTPDCPDITLNEPGDNWVLNKNFDNEMKVVVSDYNVNNLNFESFSIQSKFSNEPESKWSPLHTYFVRKEDLANSLLMNKDTIDLNANGTAYIWKTPPNVYPDSEYDLRVVANCVNAKFESDVASGYMDRQRIEVFGTPSPADGILEPNDDILLTMNETIESGGISPDNFDVRGVLNGTELKHETSLAFDGINSYATIPEYQLQNRSMTIEFWLRRSRTGQEVVVSQGTNASDQLLISFDTDNHLKFELGDASVKSKFPVTTFDWKHYAVTYDKNNNTAEVIVKDLIIKDSQLNTNSTFYPNYNSTSNIQIGKSLAENLPLFKGFMHEFRIWSQARTSGQVSVYESVTTSGRESGLIGNWSMDEAIGNEAIDKVRSRHAMLSGTEWSILPKNHSFKFNGQSDYLRAVGTGDVTLEDDVDLTFEMWFKTGANTEQVLLSNGRADGLFNSGLPNPDDKSWKIFLNSNGNVVIQSNGNQLETDTSYNDNNWHHVSAVIERSRSASIYMDGELVKTGNAIDFKGLTGPSIWLGALGWQINQRDTVNSFFTGNMDEIRIWNVARRPEQIKRDRVNQLIGDELGLQFYYPFDGVRIMGESIVRDENLIDGTDPLVDTIGHDLSLGMFINGMDTIPTTLDFDEFEAPPIKLPRRILKAKMSYSINDDKIFIELTDPPARIENVTLDITVRRLRDQAGNFMAGPKTWTAYIDKNQVFWDTEYMQFEKDIDAPLSFTGLIKNTGGSREQFSLSNIPSWLTANPSSGVIEPNSSIEVSFNVLPGINIGEYEQDIYVSTESFGFNERLLLDLKVTAEPPVWEIDANAFDYSMNIIGELKVNDIISTDEEDMVSVWINDELRGVTHIEKDPESGKSLVFLTISSDANTQDTLEIRAWDASLGRLLVGLTPDNLLFSENTIVGSPSAPQPIEATVLTQLTYIMKSGWNWISFPLYNALLSDVNNTLSGLRPTLNDEIGTGDRFDRWRDPTNSGTLDWNGNLSMQGGINTDAGYKLFLTEADTFTYEGLFIDPSLEPITIDTTWNWIGVKSEVNLDIAKALSSLNPSNGDVIKSQQQFAIYDEVFKRWSGNLDFLSPQVGYMYKSESDTTQQLIYPGTGAPLPSAITSNNSASRLKSKESSYLYKSIEPQLRTFSSNMSLIAAVSECLLSELSGRDIDLTEWMLAAHVEDESRGMAEAQWEDFTKSHLFYLTIAGDAASDLSFRLVKKDGSDEIRLNQGFGFMTNGVVGAPSAPYMFTCGQRVDCIDDRMYRTSDLNMSASFITQKARIGISSDAQMPTGIILQFRAGEKVELLQGFQTSKGARLEVHIDDCEEQKN